MPEEALTSFTVSDAYRIWPPCIWNAVID